MSSMKCSEMSQRMFSRGQGSQALCNKYASRPTHTDTHSCPIYQSLRTCLSHLQSPETAELVKNAIGASLSLILLTTSIGPGSKAPAERFDELSSLLGQGIISGIWLYAEDKPGAIHATFEALPPLLTALDIGSVRFLKVRAFIIAERDRYLTLS